MPIDLSYGDEVVAYTPDGRLTKGVVVSLDYASDDSIKAAVVRSLQDGSLSPVRPESLRYATDRNGFSFSFVHGGLLIRRNDSKLTDPKWMARTGAKRIRQSLAPKK